MAENYPVMLPELFEAIHEQFKDNPDVEADILVYLNFLNTDSKSVRRLAAEARAKLKDMNRCSKCGSALETYHYLEPHDEVDGCSMEDMYESYCPNCDIPLQMRMRDV